MGNGKLKLFCILFAVYWFVVFSPFMFEVLNQVTPIAFKMPFTFWSIHVVILLGCGLVYWGSKHAFSSYDDYLERGEDK
ncbi:MAG: hypothetical protein MR459_07885 [Enterocloster aldenensis]|nr:hypothetical protein [Enterocloster aldenensis]MDY4529354.1 hypothetical protein [Enterocloster aldenensis]